MLILENWFKNKLQSQKKRTENERERENTAMQSKFESRANIFKLKTRLKEMNVHTVYTWIEKRTETEGMYLPSFLFFSLRL